MTKKKASKKIPASEPAHNGTELGYVRLSDDLVERALSRWDTLMRIPQWKALSPRRSPSMVVRMLLVSILDQLDRLDYSYGPSRESAVAQQGDLFACPESSPIDLQGEENGTSEDL